MDRMLALLLAVVLAATPLQPVSPLPRPPGDGCEACVPEVTVPQPDEGCTCAISEEPQPASPWKSYYLPFVAEGVSGG